MHSIQKTDLSVFYNHQLNYHNQVLNYKHDVIDVAILDDFILLLYVNIICCYLFD